MYTGFIDHPAAWRSAAIGGKEGLMHRLGAEHVEALQELLARTSGRIPEQITRADFEHPVINDLMAAVRDEIMNGHGAIIVSGLDLRRYSLEEFSRIYWGLGTHLGVGAPQSYRRDRIGHVQKEEDNPTGRGYLMDVELRSHTDFHEILSLAGVRHAACGGESGLVSSLAIHNALRESRPDLLPILYEGFYQEWNNPERVSPQKVPIFCYVDGKVSCYYHTLALLNAAKTLGTELPAQLAEAMDHLNRQAARADLRADFMLEPGEMMFWHNFMVLHSRKAFKDTPERKRLLLRLWLHVPDGRPMHPLFNARAHAMDREHESGRAAIDYVAAGTFTPSLP